MRVALYARVSTETQSADPQLRDLREYVSRRGWGIVREYVDEGHSGAKKSRPALNDLMKDAKSRRFDIVLVWKFDRFARSVAHLVTALEEFRSLGIQFVSFTEQLDTTTPMGAAMFAVIGAMAQLERDLISERVKAGLRAAREKGRVGGRPTTNPVTVTIIEQARELRCAGNSFRQIAHELNIPLSSLHRIAKA